MSYNSLRVEASGVWGLQETGGTAVVGELLTGDGVISSGTIVSTTGPTSYLPNAIDLDGGKYVKTGLGLPSGNQILTTAFWVNPRAGGTAPVLFSSVVKPLLRVFNRYPSTNQFQFNAGAGSGSDTTATLTSALSIGSWNHLAVVVGFGSPFDCKVYVDGVLYGTNPVNTDPLPVVSGDDADLWIGDGAGSVNYDSDGRFAEFAIWQRELSAQEIAAWQSGPEPINTNAPIASLDGLNVVASTGSWDNQSNGTLVYDYQWYADGQEIVGETSNSIVAAEYPAGLVKCRITASNDGGFDPDQVVFTNEIQLRGAGSVSLVLDSSTLDSSAGAGVFGQLASLLDDTALNGFLKTDLVSLDVVLEDASVSSIARPKQGVVSHVLDDVLSASAAEIEWAFEEGVVRGRVFLPLDSVSLRGKNFGRFVRGGLFPEGGMELSEHQVNQ